MRDYDFERTLHRLTTGRDLHYGSWKSGQMAGAQREQHRMFGEEVQEEHPRRG